MLFWTYKILMYLMTPVLGVILHFKSKLKGKREFHSYFRIPRHQKQSSIWIHAVSLGEVNTAFSLIQSLQQTYPQYAICISTMTETGMQQATSFENVHVFYLPLDLSFLQKKLIQRIQPKCMIFIEGDVWPALSHELKKAQIPQIILSAKISEKSLSRFLKYPFIFDFIFKNIDLIGSQNIVMEERFQKLIKSQKLETTGNLKIATDSKPLKDLSRIDQLSQFLNLDSHKKTVTISCTHEEEEKLILDAIRPIIGQVNLILAPRHPQRFKDVKHSLQKHGFSVKSFSDQEKTGQIYFIDAIGLLEPIYLRSDVTILGGSFVLDIGGHNLMEPISCKCPVICGPYAFKQKQLVDLMIQEGLGLVSCLNDLQKNLKQMLESVEYQVHIVQFQTKKQNVLAASLSKIQLYLTS